MLDHVGMGDLPTLNPLDALADEIATFAARVDVAEHALLTRLRVSEHRLTLLRALAQLASVCAGLTGAWSTAPTQQVNWVMSLVHN